MIIVIGANGFLGREICKQLVYKGKPVRGMVRKLFGSDKTQFLKRIGVQLVQADLRNTHSLTTLLTGVKTVICTASSMPHSYIKEQNDIHSVDQEGVINLIDLAVEEGVEQFIYVSLSGNITLDFPLRNAKRTVEQHLRKSGLKYTILRPSLFFETWLNAFSGGGPLIEQARIFGKGTNPISLISYCDVARYAVQSIDNSYASNAILEVGGPEKLTQYDAVRILQEEGVVGYGIDEIPFETLRMQYRNAVDPMQKSIIGLRIALAKGDSIDTDELYKAFHIKLTTLKEFAHKLVFI